MKKLFLLSTYLIIAAVAFAQGVQVNAPSSVTTGENFRLELTVASDQISDVHFNGSIPNGLEEVAGPYFSTQSSYQIINGHSSSSSSARITYVFNAAKPGNYTIPSATVLVNGKRLTSRTHNVKVSGNAQGNNNNYAGPPQMHQQQQHHQEAELPTDNKNVFIKVTASKNSVVEQEPVKITYKLYTATQITVPSDLKMPNVQDFTIHEVELPTAAQWSSENIGGRTYKCVTWKQYIVYPQTIGKLTVPGSSVQVNRIVRNHNIDPFEQMLNPGGTYYEEEMQVAVPALTIDVQKLPERPANFSGGVGSFTMTSSLSKSEVKAGEPVTVTIKISGSGNLKLIKQPQVNFPADFEVYDPKVTDNTKNTNNGVEGSMTYEIIAVPQNKGSFDIPPVEFVYYDSQTSGYKTITGQPMKINVLEGDVSSSEEEYKENLKRSDIYSIKQANEIEYRDSDDFFLSSVYLILILTLVITFFVLLYIFRKRAIERADVMRMRANNANKVATKRLNLAATLMKKHKKDEFYDEVLRALWGYAADKISIPVEQLSKDNIQDKLIDRGCSTFSVEKFTAAISECEFARYAPSQDENSSMNNTYDMAVTAITEIEEALRSNKKGESGASQKSSFLISLLFLFLSFSVSTNAATTIETANASYQSGNYQQAITLYEQALKAGHSSQLYFNLGNAYFRTNQISKAILNYERAYLLDYSDTQIRHNLDYARTKTVDKMVPSDSIFIVSWYRSLVYLLSVYGWALLSLFLITISLICLLTYLFTSYLWLRKTSFWLTIVSLLFFIFSVIFALQQRYYINSNSSAIVNAKEQALKKSPEEASETIMTVHEGTHLEIIDNGMNEWKEVELPDGKTGWIKTNSILTIF